MIAAFLTALALLAQVYPLREGTVWTWTAGDRRLAGEVWDVKDGRARLRFWGPKDFNLWDAIDLTLTEVDGDLRLVGYRTADWDYVAAEPAPLLPKERKAGKTWTSTFNAGDRDTDKFRWNDFTFRLEGEERVDGVGAWKVDWTLDGVENGYRLWIAPGKGIVRIESHFKGKPEWSWRAELTRFDAARADRLEKFPELAAGSVAGLIQLLGDEDPGRRAAAEKSLRELGAGVIPLLRSALMREKDAEVRGRMESVVHSFEKVELVARAPAISKVGEPLPVRFFMVNRGPTAVVVLPCLHDSSMNLGRKFPAISATVTNPAGKVIEKDLVGSFWGAPPLRGRDFRRLAPGEELDLFAEGEGAPPSILSHSLDEPGRYTVRLTVDVSSARPEDWVTDTGKPDEEALKLLSTMPKARYMTEPLTITVGGAK